MKENLFCFHGDISLMKQTRISCSLDLFETPPCDANGVNIPYHVFPKHWSSPLIRDKVMSVYTKKHFDITDL